MCKPTSADIVMPDRVGEVVRPVVGVRLGGYKGQRGGGEDGIQHIEVNTSCLFPFLGARIRIRFRIRIRIINIG